MNHEAVFNMKSGNCFSVKFVNNMPLQKTMEHLSENNWQGLDGELPILINMQNVDYISFFPLDKTNKP